MQLCGDETAALVGDLGSRRFCFGFAGEDAPKGLIPSAVGRGGGGGADGADAEKGREGKKRGLVGESQLLSRAQDVEVAWARRDGGVHDWDAVEQLWEHALEDVLNSDPREHPLMACVASYESDEDRAKLAELFFERLQLPAAFLARNGMLSAFSVGRASALVVDVGAARACVTPVHDGYVMRKSMKQSKVAGDVVDAHLQELLESRLLPALAPEANGKPPGKPPDEPARVPLPVPCRLDYSRRRDEAEPEGGAGAGVRLAPMSADRLARVTASYAKWQGLQVLQDMKANVCRMWAELNFDEAKAALYVKECYELPDGTKVYIGADRFKSAELLANPGLDAPFVRRALGLDETSPLPPSLPALIRDALQSVHVDLRREMAQQLILVGGASILPGTVERTTKELVQALPSALKPRFLTPGRQERLFSTFTGGSILATLGSFQQLWVSKQEYEEHGADLIASRCAH